MTRLLAPRDENELIILTSLLDCNGISFHVQNEYFGGLYPGFNIFPFNERVILVSDSDFERASLLARDFLNATHESSERDEHAG
jgi:hypothetical protein